ncbi:hypothetical protein E4T56_gene19212 [Termitomyces sp. T112]|nr:hypothetical protein E4T56_gene19212 [Termitomyces sp. T112]
MSISSYTTPDRITLYDVPNLFTPGDIRRAIGDKIQEGVIDYKGFRPSGKAMINLEKTEQLGRALKALTPLYVCGIQVQPVPHYSSDPFQDSGNGSRVTGNGPDGNYPNVERNVVLWGLPGRTSVTEVTAALSKFKTDEKKGKAVVVKLDKPDGQFTIFSRFIVTMASVSEARRLVRAWHMTPWKPQSTDLIRAQILH